MRKISLLFTLILTSMVTFAVDQDEWIGSTDETYNNQFKWFAIDGVPTPAEVVNIQQPGWSEEIGIYTHKSGYNKVTFNDVEKSDGTHYHQDGAGAVLFISALTAKNTNVLFYDGDNVAWGLRIYNEKGESSGAEKTDPVLSLNETEVTLDATSSETFQILPSQDGDGVISYESNNTGIASVSETGLVTAVGRGTAIIFVRTAETDTYAPAIKKLTVTVTGPINWDAIAWLSGGNEKYKVIIEPEIANQFGGQHIENSDLWIGFPSAVFGDNSAVEHTALGAGVSFPLSQFPKEFNDFNFICDGVTYAITLYYADGEKDGGQGEGGGEEGGGEEGGGEEGGGEDQALDDVLPTTQASKILRNGQLYIERNGIRYTSTGAQVQ